MNALESYDAHYAEAEHLMDTMGISVAEARERVGLPQGNNDMFTAPRIQERNLAHVKHVDIYHLEDGPRPVLSEAQQASIEANKKIARQNIGKLAVRG